MTALDDLADDLCLWCKEPLPDTRRLGQSYCSKRCYQLHYDAIDKQARAEARSGLTCQECGGTFDGARVGQMFCSKACTRLAMRKRTWGYRTCRVCDSRFLPNHKDQVQCSTDIMECVERLKERFWREKKPA